MSVQWFFSHGGTTYGPFSEEEILDRVARKLLLKTDLVWPEDRGPKNAAPADAVFDFALPAAASVPIPDWLADVAAAEIKGPAPEPLESHETPVWLEDLRLWVGLELYTPATSSGEGPASQVGEIPDWLEGWMVPPSPKPAPPKQAPPAQAKPSLPITKPVSPAPDKPGIVTQPVPSASAPAASPLGSPPTPTARLPIAPSAPNRPAATPITAPPVTKPQAPVAVPAPPALSPQAKPYVPAENKSVAEKRANPLVETIRQASGFDLETGQILDAAKFRKWRQQQAQSTSSDQPAVSNASLFDVFRKGRIAIEAWVDDDKNRNRIIHAAADEIVANQEVQAILDQFKNYGNTLQEKLIRHLEFMVENRRRYYKAFSDRSG